VYIEHVSAPRKKPPAFEKVGECLYRFADTGSYYARLWIAGKEIRRSLGTTDWQLAKRRLRDFRKDLEKLDNEVANVTLKAYLETFLASSQNKSESTHQKFMSIAKRMHDEWPNGTGQKLREVKPSDVLRWLKFQRERYASSTYNDFVQFIRRFFESAVKDRIITESPAAAVVQAKRETPIRDTPTWEQFRAIIADIRAQKRNATAEASADCCEFMGLAGIGNAEMAALSWDDVDLKRGRLRIYRQKTDTGFMIPIYPQVRPLLERLHGKGEHQTGDKVFTVTDVRKALAGACTRLGYQHFTQRALRRCFITRAVELGIDFKTIAGMQGHRDGGVLIAKTYSHLRNEHLDRMAEKLTDS